MYRAERLGFTLIELLIVISIILLLMGFLMPILNISMRNGRIANSRITMQKVDTALLLFKQEIGGFPYFPDPWVDSSNQPVNYLGHRLCSNLGSTERADLDTALTASDTRFVNGTINTPSYPGAYYYWNTNENRSSEFSAADYYAPFNNYAAPRGLLTRMAKERSRINILAGNYDYAAPSLSGGVWKDNNVPTYSSTSRVINPSNYATDPQRRGMCIDYLSADLPESVYLDPSSRATLVDAFKTPLAYIAPLIAGVIGGTPAQGDGTRREDNQPVEPSYYALDTRSKRTPTTTLAGNRTLTSAPEQVRMYELWSAGPNGLMTTERTDNVNRDDVSLRPYHLGLQ